MFKGLMQLNYNVLVFTHFLCNVSLYNDSYLSPYLVIHPTIYCKYLHRVWMMTKGLLQPFHMLTDTEADVDPCFRIHISVDHGFCAA